MGQVYAEPTWSAYEEIREIALAGRGVDYTGGRKAHSWALEAALNWSM